MLARVRILVAAAPLLSGCFFFPHEPAGGHVHAAFRMYEDGTEVPFDQGVGDLATTGFLRCHLHLSEARNGGARYLMHLEGTLGISLRECFDMWGMDLRDERVEYHDLQDRPARSNNATHAWQVWVNECHDGGNAWTKSSALFSTRPGAHTRFLITFAPTLATTSTLNTQLDSVPSDPLIQQTSKDECPH